MSNLTELKQISDSMHTTVRNLNHEAYSDALTCAKATMERIDKLIEKIESLS